MNLKYIIERINENKQVIFVKFGDGEINCMMGWNGSNCDGDNYTQKLSNYLKMALNIFISHENSYIGRWGPENSFNILLSYINPEIKYDINQKFIDYHSIYNYENQFLIPDMHNFVEALQNTERKKIIVSNINNIKLKKVFKTDNFIEVLPNNWFYEFEKYFEKVSNEVTEDCIIITACGMGAKPLSAFLLEKHKNITILDIGSGFDVLAGHNTRGWLFSYDDIYQYYKDILPEDY